MLFGQNILKYQKRKSIEVKIDDIPLGGNYPIRVQSMTTVDTSNTELVVEQCLKMIDAGCEYIRLTTPSIKEAKNLANIRDLLSKKGFSTPLIADVHYTPNAAEEAALHIAKVRINPGNYTDKKKFEQLEYTLDEYQQEIARIRSKLLPLINLCKENKVAIRIGTNHGSLSDRIMSQYGDTPLGMVESALEFIRICHQENYDQLVISMKSSNPQVMVYAYRLLVEKLIEEKLPAYPLHLGVTEAGDGEDGRVKSAMGIGTLLADGLGDTIRVSLTEEPENEMPVAAYLAQYFDNLKPSELLSSNINLEDYNPFKYKKNTTKKVGIIGNDNVPIVISTIIPNTVDIKKQLNLVGHFQIPETGKIIKKDQSADFAYLPKGYLENELLQDSLMSIIDGVNWTKQHYKNKRISPIYPLPEVLDANFNIQSVQEASYFFVTLNVDTIDSNILVNNSRILQSLNNIVLVVTSSHTNKLQSFRRFFLMLRTLDINCPVILHLSYESTKSIEDITLEASFEVGGLFLEGFGDGIWLESKTTNDIIIDDNRLKQLNSISFNILQAARQRITKTEYISCPSCGRTLFDLQETTAKIRKETAHLKGLKIGIMGCIVNGPGEMADADYGYVGSGKDKITLYRGQEVVKKSVPTKEAVHALIGLIKDDGYWIDPNDVNEI